MAAQKPKREKGLFLRAQAWLHRRRPRFSRKSEVILLPQRVRCFGKRLLLSLPADFYAEQQKKGQILFAGSKSGLQLTVMRLPFKRPLHSISAMDLQLAFEIRSRRPPSRWPCPPIAPRTLPAALRSPVDR